MTTPQATLQNLEYHIRRVSNLLEGNEHTGDITEVLAQIEEQQDDLMCSQQRLENLMNLIVKFLGKDDVTQCCVNSNTTQSCVKIDSGFMCDQINASQSCTKKETI